MNKEEINKQIKKLKDTNGISDGYHTFLELYEHRIALFIRLVNETKDKYSWHKSKIHNDGSEYEGWFIVMGYIPEQVSYHLPIEKRSLIDCINMPKADKWDGHTSNDVIKRLIFN